MRHKINVLLLIYVSHKHVMNNKQPDRLKGLVLWESSQTDSPVSFQVFTLLIMLTSSLCQSVT